MAQVDVTAEPLIDTGSLLAGIGVHVNDPILAGTESLLAGIGAHVESPTFTETLSVSGGPPVVINATPLIDQTLLGATTAPYVYVVDSGNDRVNAYDYNGVFKFSFGTTGTGDGEFNNPNGIATNGTYLYVTDSGNNRVQIFTMVGVYVDQFGTPGTGDGEFNNPMGIAVDDRFVWVVDNGNNRFQVFDLTTYAFYHKLGEYGSGVDQFDGPTTCNVDDVYFYIYDAGNSRELKYLKNFVFTVAISADLPAITCSIVTTVTSVFIDADLPSMTCEIVTTANAVCTIDADLPGIRSSITTLASLTCTIDADLPAIGAAIETQVQLTCSIDADLPAIESSFTIIASGTVSIDADLPAITAAIITQIVGSDTFKVAVINIMTKAVTEYEQFDFNSFTDFADTQLAAHADGNIYELTGDDDAGTDIAAMFKTGDADLFKNGPMRIGDIMVLRKSAGDITLTIQGDQDTNKVKDYDIEGSDDAFPHTRRVTAPKGIRWRLLNIEVDNQDGADFDVNQIIVNEAGTSNRWQG
jgi:hypothetical protein